MAAKLIECNSERSTLDGCVYYERSKDIMLELNGDDIFATGARLALRDLGLQSQTILNSPCCH